MQIAKCWLTFLRRYLLWLVDRSDIYTTKTLLLAAANSSEPARVIHIQLILFHSVKVKLTCFTSPSSIRTTSRDRFFPAKSIFVITSFPHFWATVCKTVRPMLSDRCPVCLSICNIGVLWPNGWIDQDATWYRDRPRPRRHCIRWGSSSSPTERGEETQQPLPIFRPALL